MIRAAHLGALVLMAACAATRPMAPAPSPTVLTRGDHLEGEATVEIRIGKTPPVHVGAWTCEPRSWDEHGVARLRCIAPAGTSGFVEALSAAPEIATVHGAR